MAQRNEMFTAFDRSFIHALTPNRPARAGSATLAVTLQGVALVLGRCGIEPGRGLAGYADVAGLGALLALNDLEFDLGALIEGGSPEVIGVYEHVFAAVVRRDEAEALVCIEKLNCTFLHTVHIPHGDAFVKRYGRHIDPEGQFVLLRKQYPSTRFAVEGACPGYPDTNGVSEPKRDRVLKVLIHWPLKTLLAQVFDF